MFTNNSPPVQTLFMLQNWDVFLSPHSFKSVLLISVHIKTAFFFNEVDCWGSCGTYHRVKDFLIAHLHDKDSTYYSFFSLSLLCHMQEYALENVSTSRKVISYIWTYIYTETAKYICRDYTRSNWMIEQKVNKRFRDKIGAIQFPWTALQ